jgi:hypothetical protein
MLTTPADQRDITVDGLVQHRPTHSHGFTLRSFSLKTPPISSMSLP